MNEIPTLASVATAHNADAHAASRTAAKAALQGLDGQPPGWGLAFCGGRLDPAAAWRGLADTLPDVPIVGGATPGIIVAPGISYTGFECGLILFAQALAPVRIVTTDSVTRDPIAAGLDLGRQCQDSVNQDDTLLLLYESLTAGQPVFATGTGLLHGLRQALGPQTPQVLGSSLLGDTQFSTSFIFDGGQVAGDAAVAVVLPRTLQTHTTIMHACYPVSAFFEVTRCAGPVLLELDGRPALEVLRQMMPGTMWDQPSAGPSVLATVGQKLGDPFAPYDETRYVNHLVVGFDPREGSVTVMESDFAPGDQLQVMSRDDHLIHQSAGARAQSLCRDLVERELVFGLYIDCAGRSAAFTGCDQEEASLILPELPPGLPLLGWYSAAEIAPVANASRPMNWTGVLALFSALDATRG